MTTKRTSISFAAVVISLLILRTILVALGVGPTPLSLTTLGTAVTQNFDTLASAGTSNTVPAGWGFDESGTSSANNGFYSSGTGSQ